MDTAPPADSRSLQHSSPSEASAKSVRASASEQSSERSPDLLTVAAALYQAALATSLEAQSYLRQRHVTKTSTRRMRVGFGQPGALHDFLADDPALTNQARQIGLVDAFGKERLEGRIIIPEIQDGRCLWMVGRMLTTDGEVPKYLGVTAPKPLMGIGAIQSHEALLNRTAQRASNSPPGRTHFEVSAGSSSSRDRSICLRRSSGVCRSPVWPWLARTRASGNWSNSSPSRRGVPSGWRSTPMRRAMRARTASDQRLWPRAMLALSPGSGHHWTRRTSANWREWPERAWPCCVCCRIPRRPLYLWLRLSARSPGDSSRGVRRRRHHERLYSAAHSTGQADDRRLGAQCSPIHTPARVNVRARLARWRLARRRADEVVELIPPRAEREGALDALALENLFQSVVLSAREPIALEIYGAPHERRLLARATSARSLAHLCAQLRAHAPQVEVRRVSPRDDAASERAPADLNLAPSSLTDDPLILRVGERLRALELRPHGGAHLPLKLYEREELSAQGVDPLLGALAAMDGLPPGGRAVAQLALALAPERWSHGQQRLAVEHPLAQEQARERAQLRASATNSSGGAGTAGATGLGALAPLALLALVALALYTHAIILPLRPGSSATPRAGGMIEPSRLMGSVMALFMRLFSSNLLLTLILAISALVILIVIVRARLRHTSIYSMRLVEERTTPIAARTRLTLFAIASAPTLPLDRQPSVRRAPRPQAKADREKPDGFERQIACDRWRMDVLLRSHIGAWFATQRAHWSINTALDQTLLQLVAAYRQHHLASGAFFVARRRWLVFPARFAGGWARRARHSHDLLNVRELAALWHPPQGETETPLLERGRAHTLLAPVAPLASGYHIGDSTQANLRTAVCLPREALRHNTLLVAKTGKGKSSLLLHLALAQLTSQSGEGARMGEGADPAEQRPRPAHGDGLVVIDPHGDLVNNLLTLIPAARRDAVILVDLADTAYPVALNPLDALFGRDRDKAVESLLAVLSQIWAKFWGPRMQNALEYALKTLYEANETLIARDPQHGPDQQFTLLDVAPILSAPGFRRDVLSLTQDQALRTWWTHYYQPLDFRLQLEIINPVLTKIAAFSGSRVARRIVGQSRSTLDLGAIVRAGQVLLVNTAKGVVGAETSTLIGATLLGALQASLEEQGRLAPERAPPVPHDHR